MKARLSKPRLYILLSVLSIALGCIVYRLFEIQVVHGSEYGDLAEKQSSGKITVKADRGLIYDRKGRQIAINTVTSSLYAYPSDKKEIANDYRYLDKLYGYKAGSARRKFSLQSNHFTWIDRHLPDELARRIDQDSIPGLYLKKESQRVYPFPGVGRQLLGNTDIDCNGLSGLEYSCDSILAGRPGLIDYLRDAHRNTYRIDEIPVVEPIAGNSLILTVDWYFQEIVEEELKAAVDEYGAKEGMALFLDCRTGEILAAADYSAGGKTDIVKLKAVSDCFEPGSMFKVFTAAALLEKDLVDLDEKIYCEHGLWKCGRRVLHDDKQLDSLTFREIIELSSNIGIGKLALRVGGDDLYDNARRFGFGERSLIDLPGEQSGLVNKAKVWSDYNISALAMGHSVSVTALQLATAVAAIANGGHLYRPAIIRGVIDDRGKILKRMKPEQVADVISTDNAAILRGFMAGVVERGTAKEAQSDIVSLAGKTGTAEIPDLVNGGYFKNKFMASFFGFFPVENPKVAGVVVLKQPEPVHYGGHTAAPAFKNMAERYAIAHAERFAPQSQLLAGDDGARMIEIPDFVGQDIELAKKVAHKEGVNINANREKGVVVWQYPPEGRRIPGEEIVAVAVQSEADEDGIILFDMTGMEMRTAMAVLDYQGVDVKINGTGRVKKQFPKAGVTLKKNLSCTLRCSS